MSRIDYERLKEIVFCDTDLEVTDFDFFKIRSELLDFPKEYWYWCTYRKCFLLPLYGNLKITNKEDISWFEHTVRFSPHLKTFVERSISPYFKKLPRIIVLKTLAGQSIPPHIDCNKEEVGEFNPKLRLCLSGQNAKLEFLKREGKFVGVQPQRRIYYLSGAYTHRLQNRTSEARVTLCFGAPWTYDTAHSSLYSRFLVDQDNALFAQDIGAVDHSCYSKDWAQHKLVPNSDLWK